MNNQYHKYADDLEDFLSGLMDREREKAFKKAIETNDALSEAFKFRTHMARFWNQERKYSDTKRRVKKIMASQKRASKNRLRVFYLAASVLLLFGVSTWLWRTPAPGKSLQEFADSKDSSKQEEQSLSVSKQPEKASLYMAPAEYSPMDSLLFIRQDAWPDSGTLWIMHAEMKSETAGSYGICATMDTLVIPLMQYKPGTYVWEIEGKGPSGSFLIHPTNK